VSSTITSQRRKVDGGFPYANLDSLSLVQFRSEVWKEVQRASIETFLVI
jgi:hypothetical protein